MLSIRLHRARINHEAVQKRREPYILNCRCPSTCTTYLDLRRFQGETEYVHAAFGQCVQEHTAAMDRLLHRSEERLALVLEASQKELFDFHVSTSKVTLYRQGPGHGVAAGKGTLAPLVILSWQC